MHKIIPTEPRGLPNPIPDFDHLVYGVPDLADGVDRFEELTGVRPSPGGSHPDWGTANALLALGGDTYLEIIGPDPEQPESPGPKPFDLDRLTAPRWVAWAVKAPGIDERVARSRRQGYDPGPVVSMGRRRPDGVELAWRLALPTRWRETLGGVVPFLIDWGATPHPGGSAAAGLRLLELKGAHPEPGRVRRRLAAMGVVMAVREAALQGLEATLETPRGVVTLG